MVIPRDFHVSDLPRANLARRLNSLIAFLVAILHLYKRFMRTKPVAVLLVGVLALRSGLLELNGTKSQVGSRADYSLGLWQLVLPGALHWAAHHENGVSFGCFVPVQAVSRFRRRHHSQPDLVGARPGDLMRGTSRSRNL